MTVYNPFKPEQFALDPNIENFQIDQEVAAAIANTVYVGNPATHNTRNWTEPPVIIDPTGETATQGIHHKDEDYEGYTISLEADETDNVNRLFAREVQSAFFDDERRRKLGRTGYLGVMGAAGTVFEGGSITFALSADLPVLNKTELIASGTLFTWLLLKHAPERLRYLSMLKPGTRSNERHLESAEETAGKLELPPVISSIA